MEPWIPIGAHRLRFEGDTVFVEAHGEITGPEMIELLDRMLPVYQKYGYIFEIVDARESGSMSPEARQQNTQWYKEHDMKVEAVIYGANMMLRAIFSMVSRAIRLLSRPQVFTYFVANEADARAFVDKRRREVLAALRRTDAGKPTASPP